MCPKWHVPVTGQARTAWREVTQRAGLPPQLVVLQEEVQSVEERMWWRRRGRVSAPSHHWVCHSPTGNLSVPRWGKHFFMFYRTFGCRKGTEKTLEHFCIYGLGSGSCSWESSEDGHVKGQICEAILWDQVIVFLSSGHKQGSRVFLSALSSDLPSHGHAAQLPFPPNASVANILPTTYISVTPKIGMGKPAITKGSFPGRPRSDRYTDFNDSDKKRCWSNSIK